MRNNEEGPVPKKAVSEAAAMLPAAVPAIEITSNLQMNVMDETISSPGTLR